MIIEPRFRSGWGRAAIVLSLALVCLRGHAQSCEPAPAANAEAYKTQVAIQVQNQCFGGDADATALGKDVGALVKLARDAKDIGQKQRLLVSGADRLVNDARALAVSASPAWQPVYSALREELRAAADGLARADLIPGPVVWDPIDTAYFDGSSRFDYADRIIADCAAGSVPGQPIPSACLEALRQSANVVRIATLTKSLLDVADSGRLEAAHDTLVKLDEAWDYYFEKARSQYIWELAINSRRYSRMLREAGTTNQLVAPPADQVILFHPGVSLEYVGGGAQNATSYETVALVELIGYNRFRWGKSDDLVAKHPLGASLVATYTNDNTGDRAGYGVMLHVNNNWSLGATRRDTGAGDETTWLLSADLMKVFLEKSAAVKNKFKGGKPDKASTN